MDLGKVSTDTLINIKFCILQLYFSLNFSLINNVSC